VSRRQVRVAQSFFDRLDVLLPEERGEDGTPSTADFLLHELPPIIDVSQRATRRARSRRLMTLTSE